MQVLIILGESGQPSREQQLRQGRDPPRHVGIWDGKFPTASQVGLRGHQSARHFGGPAKLVVWLNGEDT